MAEGTAQRVWTTALGQLELYVTRANYETRLRHTVGLGVEPDNFVVGVPTALIREWLVTRLRSRVVQTVSAILGRPTEGLLDYYRWAEDFLRLNGLDV